MKKIVIYLIVLATGIFSGLNWILEREQLIKRTNLWNDESKISYIYLVSYGKVMSFHAIKGKVSSVNSMLTNPEQVVGTCNDGNMTTNCTSLIASAPAEDGSYGSNGDAVFFFTTDGVYIEWNGEYMLADQPLKLSTPPVIVRDIK